MRGSAKQSSGRRRAPSKQDRARVRLEVDERRAQLIELGIAEFGSRPYDDISIDNIAQAAGISKGLLYHYFPTKRAFYVACVRVATTHLLERLAVPPETPTFERVNLQVDRYLEFVRLHGGAFATLMRNHAGADRELATAIDETRAQVLAFLTSGLGDLLPDLSTAPLVQIAFQGWIGLVESASIAWVESNTAAKKDVVSALELRNLLVRALVSVVKSAVRTEAEPRPDTT